MGKNDNSFVYSCFLFLPSAILFVRMGGNCSPRWGSRKRAGRTEHPHRYRNPPSPNENGSRKGKWSLMKRRPGRDDDVDDVNHHPRTNSDQIASKLPEENTQKSGCHFYFNILIFCLACFLERNCWAKKLCSPYIYSSFQSAKHSSFGYEWTGNSRLPSPFHPRD